jgi:DNA-binding transcriptional ArsR family regulator
VARRRPDLLDGDAVVQTLCERRRTSARAEGTRRYRDGMTTDIDISTPAGLLADPGRARILFALADGRALAASVLAAEAEVAPSTASEHLRRLLDGGMLEVESQGRHRYYRITRPEVVHLLEVLAQVAPPKPVRSLRQGHRAHALRQARLCYDHLGGRLAVAIMARLLELGVLEGGDGLHHLGRGGSDRLSAPGHDIDYRLGDHGAARLRQLGVDLDAATSGRRPLIRYCVDWSEQRHHLAGALGAAIVHWLLDRAWIRRSAHSRAVHLTEAGRAGLAAALGLHLSDGGEPVDGRAACPQGPAVAAPGPGASSPADPGWCQWAVPACSPVKMSRMRRAASTA